MSDSSRKAARSAEEQRGALLALQEAHVREKRAADDSLARQSALAGKARETADAYRAQAREVRASADSLRAQRNAAVAATEASHNEARGLRDAARARADQAGAIDKTAARLLKQADAARREADVNRRAAQSISQSIRDIERRATAIERDADASERSARAADSLASRHARSSSIASRSIATVVRQIATLDNRTTSSAASAGRFSRALERVGIGGRNAASNLRGLNAEFQGLAIALVVKYAQALITALAGLAAQFVAVAAAAGQAAAGIAAAVGAGAAQAAPVVGVLAASFARLAAVMKVVKLANDQQLRASQDAQTAARAQRTAADQIRSAEERVADAHRNSEQAVDSLSQARSDAAREAIRAQNDVARAQQEGDRNVARAQADVTQARKDAIRTVQDLIAAEEQASLSADQAQAALRRAIQGGDVAGTAQANLDVDTSRRDLTRARQDAAPARARGVEGIQSVIDAELRLADIRRQSVDQINQAEQQLADTRRSNARQIEGAEQAVADARRQEGRASADLVRTRREARENLEQETSAANKLKDALNQLSPAERTLYRRLVALQETYRRAARPITDILTRAFTEVVDRTIALLRDPRILGSFRAIAVQLSASIRTGLREATGGESVGAFQILSAEAVRNIPTVTRILVNLFRASRNVIIAALPAFRLLLDYVEGYSRGLEDLSRSTGLTDFFVTGIEYARSFFELGLSIARLFLALAGPGGGAAEGARTIDYLSGRIDDLTQKVRDNADQVRDFFAGSRVVLDSVIDVVAALGSAIIKAFDPDSVRALSEFLIRVVIPALVNVIEIMGFLTQAFHQLFSLPGFAEFAQVAVTLILLAKGFTILRLAVADIMAIIPGFLRAFGLMGLASRGAAAGLAALSGPAGWVVLAIVAIISAIALLDRKFHFIAPTFRWLARAAVNAFEWIKTAAVDTFHWVTQAFSDIISWFSDVWTQGLLYWLRYPFQEAGKWLGGQGWFQGIIRAVGNVISFFAGPAWATLKAMIIGPFEAARVAIDIIWGIIKSIVVVALDIISGRFDRIGPQLMGIWKGIWDGIADAMRTALNLLIDMLNKTIDAINKISPVGDIGHIDRLTDNTVDAADKTQDAANKIGRSYDHVGDKAESSADRSEKAMERVSASIEKAGSDSERAFKQLAEGGHAHLKDIREVTEINMAAISGSLNRHSRAGKQALAENFRQAARAVKEQMDAGRVSTRSGMRAIRGYLEDELQVYGFTLRQARNEMKKNQRFDAGPEEGVAQRGLAGGGMVSGFGGWPRDDHTVVDPYGRPVAAVSGNEGIVNPPQMARINQWGSIIQSLGLDSYGSLQDLWGMRGGGVFGGHSSTVNRFAGGGSQIVPVPGFPGERAARSILDEIAWVVRNFRGLVLTDAYGQGHKSPGHTRTGTAADFSGPDAAMDRAVRALVARGYLVGYDGRFGSQNWPGHGPSTRTPNFHLHVEFAGKQKDLGTTSVATAKRIPRIPITGGGAVGRLVQRTLDIARASAQRTLNTSGASLTTPIPGGRSAKAMSADADVVSAFRRAINAANATRVEALALWEAGIVESGLKNLNFGDADSLGALQERVSIYGRGHALNPYASALRFLREARPFRPWRGSAGMLAANVQRPAAQYRGRYDQVAGQARRYLQTGGPIKGLPAPRPVRRGPALATSLQIAIRPALDAINGTIEEVTASLEQVSKRALRNSRKIVTRLTRVFDALTGEGGSLDRIRESVSQIATRAAVRLQQRQFRIGRAGPQRGVTSDVENAQVALGTLRETRGALNEERDTIQGSIAGAQRAVNDAVRRNNKKAENVARAALTNLRARLEQNTTDMAQNAQDQVEAVESYQQALLDSVTANAERNNSAIDRWARTAAALGVSVDPNVVLGKQVDNMRQQIGGLQGVLAQALRTGNVNLAQQVRSQIDDLNVQIAEAVAQQFQNAVDAVNNEAQRQTTRLDRAARRAQIGGIDFAALGNTLTGRGQVLQTQRAGLQALMNQAAGAGNLDQFNNLADQIDELDTALLENTQAIKDNTDAAFNATTQQVNDRFGFTSGVFGGLQGFLQAFTESTGMDTLAAQVTALQGTSSALATQQQGLVGQLVKLTGDQGALGLTGRALVDYLVGISSGPVFQSIMAGLDPTQQAAFQDLVTSLITNATATEQNTKALHDVAAPSSQSFTSSFWTAFRSAVFTGAGGLLPQYQMTIPGAAVGARVVNSGALMVHAGESVRPAAINRDWGGDRSNDTYNLNLTSPTEVLNPTDVGRQLAFYRKTSGR